MDNNLNDIFNKFNNILKDKNIDLGKVFGDEEENNTSSFDFDLDTILKFKKIFEKLNNNSSPRNNLLYSLKPFLSEPKKEKLDQYIKIANLLEVLSFMNNEN